jgi:hypothetical protein
MIMLEEILKKRNVRMQARLMWLGDGSVPGSCELSNEPSKGREFLDKLND